MLRLLIALFHMVLAAGTTTGGLFVLGQASANMAWENGFYGVVSQGTWLLVWTAVVAVAFGLAHGTAAAAWFAGTGWGTWVVVGASLLLLPSAPWPVGILLVLTSLLVMADQMVRNHRRRQPDPPPPTR